MVVAAMAMMVMMVWVVVLNLLLLGLLGLLAALVDDSNVVIKNGGNDGDHVGLDDSGADILGASNADIDDALKREVPFPHAHHVFAATLLEDAD